MRRYWVPKEQRAGDTFVLIGDLLHHIRDVCRMHMGSKFEVLVEGGEAHLVEIVHETKRDSIAKILETRKIPPLPEPHIHVALSIPRLPVFEAVLEKAVELGVHTIHPFYSDFSYFRTKSDPFDKKRSRFEKIILSATQQSGRGELLQLAEPLRFEEKLDEFQARANAVGLFAYEGHGVLSMREAVEALRQPELASEVWIFVGSEGGFSEREVAVFNERGMKPVTLGAQVLRVETACVTLVAVIKYGFDLMR